MFSHSTLCYIALCYILCHLQQASKSEIRSKYKEKTLLLFMIFLLSIVVLHHIACKIWHCGFFFYCSALCCTVLYCMVLHCLLSATGQQVGGCDSSAEGRTGRHQRPAFPVCSRCESAEVVLAVSQLGRFISDCKTLFWLGFLFFFFFFLLMGCQVFHKSHIKV